ncbi:hypothetical protein BC827DRAFT_1179728, partial [Russula dissimulans]
MGGASSTQRGSKITQSQTILQQSTNANTPKDIAQVANIAKTKNDLISPSPEHQDLRKDNATPAIPSETFKDTTDPATNFADRLGTIPPSGVGLASDSTLTNINETNLSETQPILEAVISQHIEDAPNRVLALAPADPALTRINVRDRDPKIGTSAQSKKRSRRVRGKGKAAEVLQLQENIPPPAGRQSQARRRRAHGPSRGEMCTGPAPRRARGRGVETANLVNHGTSRSTPVDVHAAHVIETHDGGKNHPDDAVIGPTRRTIRQLPSHGTHGTRKKSGLGVVPEEVIERPKADSLSEESPRQSLVAPSAHEETVFPEPGGESDISLVPPLPSSARRRAKEYFQRRTRERSADAARRQTRPPRRSATVTEPGVPVNPRSQVDLNEAAVAKASEKSSGGNASVSANAQPDHFAFDPEASPFTPNATSSPRQASVSSIGVQSFTSPTPLPSHGSRKVAPLILPKASNRNTRSETRCDFVPSSILMPISHGIQGTQLAYIYGGANQAQAHLQAEQIALMRLQAYYNWLAGNIPATGVSNGLSVWEHMDMSGGSGGLSGGVALGRQGQSQIQGRGKGQCRSTSGAYAHPKEHVVFSPRDHEQTEVASQYRGTMPVKVGMDDKKKEAEAEEAATLKWDRKWGLREGPGSGKEIGWSWGMRDVDAAAGVVGEGSVSAYGL